MLENEKTTQADALEAAVQTAYKTFAAYTAPQDLLDVCTACCMDAALEREMRRLPLRQLTEQHFYQYNDSAKSLEQPADEIKYLLPRLLELLAQGARLHHSTELYLDRVGRCALGSFNAKEQAALAAVALAHFALGLEQWGQSDGVFQGDDAFAILLMWDYAGVPLGPLLDYWLACESDSAALHFVDACFWDWLRNGGYIANAFTEDRPAFRATLDDWLADTAVRARWADKLVRLGPVSDWLPVCHCGTCHHSVNERIGAVFDAMAE